MKNPFKYGCVVGGDSFCARPELERKLVSFVQSGQNVLVQGARRMGKTSLVRETVGRMRGVALVYADFLGVCDQADLCARLAYALAECAKTLPFYRKLAKLLAMLRPVVSIDADSGMPVFSLDRASASAPGSLDAVLSAIAEEAKNRRLCVVFDEFQDILGIADGARTLAVMRSRIQLDPSTPYIFLGSVRNKMTDIFWNPDSPFYHSASSLPVGEIPLDDFYSFAAKKFAAGGRTLPRETFEAVFVSSQGIPGYIQELCDAIWDCTESGTTIGAKELAEGLQRVFAREREHYEIFMERLTPIQRKVVAALAHSGGKSVYSSAFLACAQVSGIGTMRRSLEKLVSEKLIYRHEGEYKFFNPFFCQMAGIAEVGDLGRL